MAMDASVSCVEERRKLGLLAMERTRTPMVVTDPRKADNPIVLANDAFLALTGYDAEEVIGSNCRFMQGPDTDPAAVARLRAAVAEAREFTTEILNYHRDGRPFWNQLLISPVFGDDGELMYFFASQIDVTDRKSAQELSAAERLLLKEVDHRAKNALALVQAIMRLSSSEDSKVYARIVQGRVDALARTHALLSDSRWRGVLINRIVQSEVQAFARNRISAVGPVVMIAPEQVQPLALLLHEMLQNATRYGALSLPDGRVRLGWRLSNDQQLVIVWSEMGGPPVQSEPRPALGMTMMSTMIERQLQGRSVFAWTADGLEARITFPIARGMDAKKGASAAMSAT
jgi:PAS domain S-box-containing protein